MTRRATAVAIGGVLAALTSCGLTVIGTAGGDIAARDGVEGGPGGATTLDPIVHNPSAGPDGDRDGGPGHADANAPRIREGLLALYTFERGLEDSSGVEPALDLEIASGGAVIDGGAVTIESGRLTTRAPATRVTKRIKETSALTIEAWVTPASDGLAGPARIVGLSLDPTHRNVTLAVSPSGYVARLRTTLTGDNGVDQGGEVEVPPAPVKQLTHVVFTRAASGARALYRNGARTDLAPADGGLSAWDDGYFLSVANELTDDRQWRGRIDRIAVYDRDLRPEEVLASFQAGP